jgi:DNA-binding NtrC family response regulator
MGEGAQEDNGREGDFLLAPEFLGQRSFKSLVFEYERSLILQALEKTGGNKRQAAAILQILPTTLHEKMRRLGLFESPRPETGT